MEETAVPRHIGIIMDGNGRWAKQRGLPRSAGHEEGVKVFDRICDYAAELRIPALTFYAFSTENWNRPQPEVDAIMQLFRNHLDEMEERREENEKKRFRIRYIGDFNPSGSIPPDIIERIHSMERRSADKDKTIINIAVNYGGQAEILHAAKRLAELALQFRLNPAEMTVQDFENQLYTAGMPPLDLIIRPSGEQRLSNFLLWQSAYSELWFSNVLWPDFSERDFDAALADFAKRKRRFGN